MPFTLMYRLCSICTHRHPDTHPPTCDAFPQRIPTDIRVMRADHREPYEGDHGIRFEMREGKEAEYELAVKEFTRKRWVMPGTPIWNVLSDAQREEFRRILDGEPPPDPNPRRSKPPPKHLREDAAEAD